MMSKSDDDAYHKRRDAALAKYRAATGADRIPGLTARLEVKAALIAAGVPANAAEFAADDVLLTLEYQEFESGVVQRFDAVGAAEAIKRGPMGRYLGPADDAKAAPSRDEQIAELFKLPGAARIAEGRKRGLI